jgi:hypothetical protein
LHYLFSYLLCYSFFYLLLVSLLSPYFMLELKLLLTEWETEIHRLEAAIKNVRIHHQRHRLQMNLRRAYQSMQLLHGISQQLLT